MSCELIFRANPTGSKGIIKTEHWLSLKRTFLAENYLICSIFLPCQQLSALTLSFIVEYTQKFQANSSIHSTNKTYKYEFHG